MDETERYARIRSLFERVCDLPDADRDAALAAEPDAAIRARVVSLLALESQTTAGVGAPVRGLLGELAGVEELKPGDRLGAWTLRQPLGAGGMGSVFSAARSDGHFEQTAAVKLLRGVPSPAALEFLTRERQILAGLAHPNIARLIDGGATPAGQPFLVMEQVDGVPIDRWCREQALPVDGILALMITVAQAIRFAHGQLIVHCDLKPSNILVDGSGRPCLLDFGIARLIDADEDPRRPSSTSARARAFTPGYASPEQESGGAVGTASDIYSLGRLIEELLGRERLSGDAELAAIVARATATAPADRYPSADALAADLARYRAREPLAAMPATPWYLARTWLRRRWPVAAAAAVFLLTVAGFTVQLMADRDRARDAERRALAERDRATQAETASRQINEFLLSMLDGANPDAGSGEVPISTLVEQALRRIDTELAGQPALQAELFAKLGRVQVELANPKAAKASFERALALEHTLDRPQLLADLLLRIGRLHRASFDVADAEAPAREAVQLLDRTAPPKSELHADALQFLASVLSDRGQLDEAEALFQRALVLQDAIDPRGTGMAELLEVYAGHRMTREQWGAAEDLLRRSLALRGDRDPEASLNAKEMLGRALGRQHRVDEAVALLQEALAQRRHFSGDGDVSIPWRLSELASVYGSHGRAMEAMPLFREALEIGARKLGVDSIGYAVLLNNASRNRYYAGDTAGAIAGERQALATVLGPWGESNPGVATFRTLLGLFLMREQPKEAAQLLEKAEAVLAAQAAPNATDLAKARLLLAQVAAQQQDPATARHWLAASDQAKPKPQGVAEADRTLVAALIDAAEGHRESARAGLERAEAQRVAAIGEGDARIWLARIDRAEFLTAGGVGERAEAARLAKEILGHLDAALVPDAPVRRRLQELIAKG